MLDESDDLESAKKSDLLDPSNRNPFVKLRTTPKPNRLGRKERQFSSRYQMKASKNR